MDEQQITSGGEWKTSETTRQLPAAKQRLPNKDRESPVLLAIDTCTSRSSIALRDATTLRAECSWETDRHHTAAVSAHIRRLMHSCDVKAVDLGAVAVAIGPGSFTGVRCGLAIAKGFGTARGLPLIGVTTFDIIVAAQPDQHIPIFVLVEAGRGRVAVCCYEWQGEAPTVASKWHIQTWQEFANSVASPAWVCGDLTPGLALLLETRVAIAPAPLNLRRAGYLAEIGYGRWLRAEINDVMTLVPIYPAQN